jgi:hypothetical protein
MSQDSAVYDLGDLDRGRSEPASTAHPSRFDRPPGPREVRRRPSPAARPASAGSGRELGQSLSVVLPGFGQLVRGDRSLGLFYLTSVGFVAALAWALTASVDRLAGTLALLGYPPAAAVWMLCMLFATAAALHLASVLDAASPVSPSRPPAVPAIASLFIPGWGQLLNGDRIRAVLFLGGVWLAGAGWILVSPAATDLMAELRLYLPSWASLLATPAVRWTVPAILWTLAVYDAASRATYRRDVRP